MALTQIQIKDAGNVTRTVQVNSDTGVITGNLSFLQTIAGADGANPASLTNAFPIQGNIAIPAGVSVTGGNLTSAGNVTANIQLNGNLPGLTNPIWIANAEAADVTGTFTNATQTGNVSNTSADGYAAALLSINGTYATASGVFEASDDSGTTWYALLATRSDGSASETGYTSLTNTNRQWTASVGGNDSVRIRSTAVATGTVNARVGISASSPSSGVVSGNVSVTGNLTSAGNITAIVGALPAGGNIIGALTGNQTVNLNQVGGTAAVTGGVAGSLGVGGLAASGVAVAGAPILTGGRAQNVEPAAVANGQAVDMAFGLEGKAIILPYANKENFVRGGNVTGNTTAMVMLPAAGAGLKNYITGIQIGNSGNTTVNVTFNDVATLGNSSTFIAPTGGGNNPPLSVPLVTAANTTLTATLSGNSTSVTVNVQGYTGT